MTYILYPTVSTTWIQGNGIYVLYYMRPAIHQMVRYVIRWDLGSVVISRDLVDLT